MKPVVLVGLVVIIVAVAIAGFVLLTRAPAPTPTPLPTVSPTISPGPTEAPPATPAPTFVPTGNVTVGAGDWVSVNYIGSLENGTVFDTSLESVALQHNMTQTHDYGPFNFTVGAQQAIVGFDEAVLGMRKGESKVVTIPPEKAYGNWSARNVMYVASQSLQEQGIPVVIGQEVWSSRGAQGHIVNISANGTVGIDFNPFFIGKNLVFDITVVDIRKAVATPVANVTATATVSASPSPT